MKKYILAVLALGLAITAVALNPRKEGVFAESVSVTNFLGESVVHSIMITSSNTQSATVTAHMLTEPGATNILVKETSATADTVLWMADAPVQWEFGESITITVTTGAGVNWFYYIVTDSP